MKTTLLSVVLALGLAAQQPPVRSLICEPSSASGTTYTCTGAPTLGAYTTGLRIQFKADVANTGAVTINVDTLGAKALTKLAGGINTALAANDLRAGQYALAIYDGTQFQMLSQIGNTPSGGSGSIFTINMTQTTLAASTTNAVYGTAGLTTAQNTSSTYSRVSMPAPQACTLKNLFVLMGAAQPAGGTLVITAFVNGADTALTCAVSAGGTTCNDTTHTVSIAQGDLVAVHAANNSGTGASTYFNVTAVCQ